MCARGRRAANGDLNELALQMAGHAHQLCEALRQVLAAESMEAQRLRELHTLLPDLAPAELADLCSQTICYALFAARLCTPDAAPIEPSSPRRALPITDAFLRGLFAFMASPRLAHRVKDILTTLCEMLNGCEPALLTRASGVQHALIHFYESFLRAYNPQTRVARGVYYTPDPVVMYIVRSVDLLLRRDFARPAGLAMARGIELLDPAMGTGAFLHGVIAHIYGAFQGSARAWRTSVSRRLLPQFHGCELLPAPYLVAHVCLGLQLAATGYDIRRARAALQLSRGDILAGPPEPGPNSALQIIMGNPPYANFGRLNRSPWIQHLLEDYKRGLGERKLNLDDDFIKFMRFGQWRIEQAGRGILAFITNHTYLDGLTHRQMRRSLLDSFDDIYILDLHGNSKRRDYYQHASRDENVFPIQQGVAIGIFVRREKVQRAPANVRYAELRGPRESKFALLEALNLATTPWRELQPEPEHLFFVPRRLEGWSEWQSFTSLAEIFPLSGTGVKTHLDAVLVGESDACVAHKIERFVAEHAEGAPEGRGSASHKAALLRRALAEQTACYSDYAYRPFDTRRIAYLPRAIEAGDHRLPLMRHALSGSVMLAATRQVSQGSFAHAFVSAALTDMCLLSSATRECAYCFPLYLYASESDGPRPNLAPEFISGLEMRLGLAFTPRGPGDLRASFGPEDLLAYIYALLHAPTYRRRYAEFLKSDFPRLPLPADAQSFRALCRPGAELLATHLLRKSLPASADYPFAGENLVERIQYDNEGRVWINTEQYFSGISRATWELRIGGYQVCRKWLKDRRGRRLHTEEIAHYQRIVAALSETLRLMAGIEEIVRSQWGEE